MRRLLVCAFLAVCMSSSLTACAHMGNWWSDLKTDPVTASERFIATAENVVDAAGITMNQVVLFLPEAQQDLYLNRFDDAQLAFTEAVGAVRAAVQAAAELKEKDPNLSKVLSDLSRAVLEVKDVVDQVRKLITDKPGVPPSVALSGVEPAPHDALDSLTSSFRVEAIRVGANPMQNF